MTLSDERYLASIVAAADDAIICNDRDGRITSWNAGAERMLGYTAPEVVGRDISLLFTPHGQRDEAAALVQIWSGERSACSDRVLVGEERPARRGVDHHVADPRRGGRARRRVEDLPPLGSRRDVEIAARHLAAIVASSDDAIISKNLNGIVQTWNPAAELPVRVSPRRK